jgi:hypothetical protein
MSKYEDLAKIVALMKKVNTDKCFIGASKCYHSQFWGDREELS